MWEKDCNMSVEKFVAFLNFYHLSMADFLIVRPSVLIRKTKEDYIIPNEIWTPIEWKNEELAKTFGVGSITGELNRKALADSLGFGSNTILTWITKKGAMKMSVLISLLNKYKIDANVFIKDLNKAIPVPKWEDNESIRKIGERMEEKEREKKMLSNQLKDRDSLIAQMRIEMDRLKNENEVLRKKSTLAVGTTGILSEPSSIYEALSSKKRYVFHRELWERLPEVFEMTDVEFRNTFGLITADMNSGNVKIDKLIKVCNSLRMSVWHFFPPAGEPLVVNHRSWYEISPHLFRPIEGRMENLKYIFKKKTFGYTREQFESMTGIGRKGFRSLTKEGGKARMVLTLLNVCNTFNLPISVFVDDPNDRYKPAYSVSLNETLMSNCIEMAKELERLRSKLGERESYEDDSL